MSNTTVAQFAAELNRPVDDLLKQLKEAGVNKNSGNDSITTQRLIFCSEVNRIGEPKGNRVLTG